MMNRQIPAVFFGVVILGMAGLAGAYAPTLDIVTEYDDHSNTLVDVEYDDQFDFVYSLDEDGTFLVYQIQEENAEEITRFNAGHALTVGSDVVYIAATDTLWEFDIVEGELTELTDLEIHPPAIDYDGNRDVIWVAGNDTVYGYNAGDGTEYMTYSEHTQGIADISANGDYVATGTTWTDEVVVYDVESESVAFEPDLPTDVGQVSAVHITNNEELIVGTGAEDGDVVAMFDITEQEQMVDYREHIFSVSALEYVENHDIIISMGFDNTIKFYDVEADEVADIYEHEDTIYTGSLDTRNGILWFGDGEERDGTVTGINISYEEATPTPTSADSSTPTQIREETPTPGSEATTTSADGPGFGIAATIIALVLTLVLYRRP